jgi:hypothetical protein
LLSNARVASGRPRSRSVIAGLKLLTCEASDAAPTLPRVEIIAAWR